MKRLLLLFALAAFGASASEQYWLASKYDGRQAMIYFDTVHFGESWPANAEQLYPAAGFGIPSLLTPAYVNHIQDRPGAVHFALGEKYDLLMDGNFVQSATVTKLVGWIGDEGVGNDSYIGAMVSLDKTDIPLLEDWFVARKHIQSKTNPGPARLLKAPVTLDLESTIASLVNKQKTSPMLTVQAFTLADGSWRYYARCGWNDPDAQFNPAVAIGVWLSPEPMLHVLATEPKTSSYGFDVAVPRLTNVLDLGDGRTALIVESFGDDSMATQLLVYKDGPIKNMEVLQTLASAE